MILRYDVDQIKRAIAITRTRHVVLVNLRRQPLAHRPAVRQHDVGQELALQCGDARHHRFPLGSDCQQERPPALATGLRRGVPLRSRRPAGNVRRASVSRQPTASSGLPAPGGRTYDTVGEIGHVGHVSGPGADQFRPSMRRDAPRQARGFYHSCVHRPFRRWVTRSACKA